MENKDGNVLSLLFAGVGGQGILRSSDILSQVAIESGLDAKKSEVHGMAQRGGCVTSHVRFGRKVYSPLAKKGSIDILVAFEKLEALRYLDFLKKDATVIINEEEIYPPSVNLGSASYPNEIRQTVENIFKTVKVVNAPRIAAEAGNVRAANTVLLGVLSSFLDFTETVWEKALNAAFPEKLRQANLKAFQMGRIS